MNSSPAFDAVVFDVGGTLLRVAHDPQERALARIAHLGAVPIGPFRDGVRQAVTEWHASGGPPHEEDLPATWVRHYQRALSIAGFAGDRVHAAQLIEDGFLTDGWDVFPDAEPLLRVLRLRGITLGVVSNWPATLDHTLERAGLRTYFDVIVASAVVGYAKPRSEIFHIAAERLQVPHKRILYVGDSIEHDLHGATAAGMSAVLIDRFAAHPTHAPRVVNLADVEGLLA